MCYHIPSDRDDVEHPNAFAIEKPTNEITLKDIKNLFPLPGEYHFRFKVKMEGGSFWLDSKEDDSPVPAWSPRRIITKVLRLSWSDNKVSGRSVETKTTATVQHEIPRPSHADLFGGSSPPRFQAAAVQPGVTELDLFS